MNTILKYSHNEVIYIVSQIFGWIYFVAWTVSFYPQVYTNFKRKSVIGLDLDFLTLNITGFLCYSLFNLGLYFIPRITVEAIGLQASNINPVQINDVVFSLHALLITIFIGIQAIVYERGTQTISWTCKCILVLIYALILICLALSIGRILLWINFLYAVSYVKLFITSIKYIPQAYLNYRRKSTVGWNVWGVILDAVGGIFSLVQMFLLSCAIAAPSYTPVNGTTRQNCVLDLFLGNPTKMLLSLTSLCYDAALVYQHYVLYPNLVDESYQEIPGTVVPSNLWGETWDGTADDGHAPAASPSGLLISIPKN